MTAPLSTLGRAAVAYAERLHFAVFPVALDCRVPIKERGWFEHGCHDASSDPAEIARRWSKHPTANIAVACGALSGVSALDLDAKGDVDGFASLARLEADFGPLPRTWRSATPSGGEHRFFRHPAGWDLRNKVGLRVHHPDGSRTLYAGLDIRTTGGSVALPPSRKPHGVYRWIDDPSTVPLADAPEWLLKLAIDAPPPVRTNRAPLRLQSSDRAAKYVERAIEGECSALAGMGPNTGRNLRLFQAAANLGELVGGGLAPRDLIERALEQAAYDCGLHADDGGWDGVRKTIASGMNRGMAKPREVSL